MTERETMGERLKRLREAAGMTQQALANAAGLSSQGTVGNIERGTRGYGDSVVSIAQALGVSPRYLLMQSADATPAPYGPPAALNPSPATEQEARLLVAYRLLPSEDRQKILQDLETQAHEADRKLREFMRERFNVTGFKSDEEIARALAKANDKLKNSKRPKAPKPG